MTALDLHDLSARIGRAEPALVRARARLVASPPPGMLEEEQAAHFAELGRFAEDFAGIRGIAGQATYQALDTLTPSPLETDLVLGLRRWIYELLQERVGWPLFAAEAAAWHAPASPPRPRAKAEDGARPDEEPAVHRLAPTFADAHRALVVAAHPRAADDALRRANELSAPIAAARKEQRARRFEVAARLGLAHPWSLVSTSSPAEIQALAAGILDRTEPLARALSKERRRRAEGSMVELARGPAYAIHDAFGRGAGEGWPAHLTSRWFEESFRAIPRAPRVSLTSAGGSAPLGAASFLRAARVWGGALRGAGVPRSLPWVVARDPYPVAAAALGDVFALTLARTVFARRKLGLVARSAAAHARVTGQVILFELRGAAALVLAGFVPWPPADLVAELADRLFGAPLPAAIAPVWAAGGLSGKARILAPVRLLGAVLAHDLEANLVQRFDEDWFDNPKAGGHLATINAGPAWSSDPIPGGATIDAVGRALEEALG